MIIGIDLSLCNTGIVLLDDDNVMLEHSIISKPQGKRPIDELERLMSIVNQVEHVIRKHEIKLAVVEGIAFGISRTTSLSQLSGLNYMVRHMLHREEVDFLIVPPTTLKKFITGKGNSPKDVMLLETYKRYKKAYTDNNLCDGFGLAKIGEVFLDPDKGVKFQKDVVKVLKKQI